MDFPSSRKISGHSGGQDDSIHTAPRLYSEKGNRERIKVAGDVQLKRTGKKQQYESNGRKERVAGIIND